MHWLWVLGHSYGDRWVANFSLILKDIFERWLWNLDRLSFMRKIVTTKWKMPIISTFRTMPKRSWKFFSSQRKWFLDFQVIYLLFHLIAWVEIKHSDWYITTQLIILGLQLSNYFRIRTDHLTLFPEISLKTGSSIASHLFGFTY